MAKWKKFTCDTLRPSGHRRSEFLISFFQITLFYFYFIALSTFVNHCSLWKRKDPSPSQVTFIVIIDAEKENISRQSLL